MSDTPLTPEELRRHLGRTMTAGWEIAEYEKLYTIYQQSCEEVAEFKRENTAVFIERDKAEKENGQLREALAVSRSIEHSFWEGLKSLNLESIDVKNPGRHITEAIANLTAEVDHYRVKAECYGNIVHGCSPALEKAGFPVDTSMPQGAVGGIKKAVEALTAKLNILEAVVSLAKHADNCPANPRVYKGIVGQLVPECTCGLSLAQAGMASTLILNLTEKLEAEKQKYMELFAQMERRKSAVEFAESLRAERDALTAKLAGAVILISNGQDRLRDLTGKLEAAERHIQDIRPQNDAYLRVCQTLGIEHDILGYVNKQAECIHTYKSLLSRCMPWLEEHQGCLTSEDCRSGELDTLVKELEPKVM